MMALFFLLNNPSGGMLLVLIFPLWILVELGLVVALVAHIVNHRNIDAPSHLWWAFVVTSVIIYIQLTSN
jgi:hypothetical protein